MENKLCRIIGVTHPENNHRIGYIVRRGVFYKDGELIPTSGQLKDGDGFECVCGLEVVYVAPHHLEEV
jgi:hypothetical protein